MHVARLAGGNAVPGSTRTDPTLLVAWLGAFAASWIFVLIMGRHSAVVGTLLLLAAMLVVGSWTYSKRRRPSRA